MAMVNTEKPRGKRLSGLITDTHCEINSSKVIPKSVNLKNRLIQLLLESIFACKVKNPVKVQTYCTITVFKQRKAKGIIPRLMCILF